MFGEMRCNFYFFCACLYLTLIHAQEIPYLVGLNSHCLRCLCYAATGCNLTLGCDKGYCGPYKISRIYWKEAGEITLPDDDKERAGAYEDCALSYRCAQKIVANYIVRLGKDCNGDGVTNCDDYSMMHFNGGYQCQTALNKSEPGRKWLQRYRTCNPQGEDIFDTFE